MKTYIITGATGGLGYEIAQQLAQQPNTKVVFAVRDIDKARQLTLYWKPEVDIRALDLADRHSVDAFIKSWQGPIAGLINNAAVQIVSGTCYTAEGIEETIAVNHLAALKLTLGLLPNLRGGRVLFIGSGSHHPKNFTAGIFGFRGAQFQSITSSVKGESTGKSKKQDGMDRYATSKFLNMVTTVELAKRLKGSEVSVYCLDPGLMAGTGLVRTGPSVMILGWKYILPLFAWLLPDKSNPLRSAQAAVWIMQQQPNPPSGTLYSYHKKPAEGIWDRVYDSQLGKQVLDDSMAVLSGEAMISAQPS